MIGRLFVLGGALTAAVPVTAEAGEPLTMTCHLMIRGAPSPDVTTFSLVGNDLFSSDGGTRTRISTAGTPLALGSSRDGGVMTRSFATHARNGPVVTRRVYWQTGTKPRYVRFTETYDFAKQTITSTGEPGDSCHHKG